MGASVTIGEAIGEQVGGLKILTPHGLRGSRALLLPGVFGALMVTLSRAEHLATGVLSSLSFLLRKCGELERTDMGDSSVLGVMVRRNSLGELMMDL